ncbi:hypothetical protein [Thermomonospora cellulosilytica]|uniref:Uncharacterized protein n=1 Tax=Thermomonospora cellulosilytica TaxID=1411118 RepID=A0A7W3RA02_9ACTN|nr:hypothetical protein [Thermomonospora cellulosilytica]MBA9005893.1 hypothetical protein [Thermomonospora cellulosilytica]
MSTHTVPAPWEEMAFPQPHMDTRVPAAAVDYVIWSGTPDQLDAGGVRDTRRSVTGVSPSQLARQVRDGLIEDGAPADVWVLVWDMRPYRLPGRPSSRNNPGDPHHALAVAGPVRGPAAALVMERLKMAWHRGQLQQQATDLARQVGVEEAARLSGLDAAEIEELLADPYGCHGYPGNPTA